MQFCAAANCWYEPRVDESQNTAQRSEIVHQQRRACNHWRQRCCSCQAARNRSAKRTRQRSGRTLQLEQDVDLSAEYVPGEQSTQPLAPVPSIVAVPAAKLRVSWSDSTAETRT